MSNASGSKDVPPSLEFVRPHQIALAGAPHPQQRRTAVPKPRIYPSSSSKAVNIVPPRPMVPQPKPGLSNPSPADQMEYIRCQGSLSKTPELSGKNCPLCKRDFSYTPQGPVMVPKEPPMTACLPCGHLFHDHCLNLITPSEEARNPPCIPCAMGEK